MKVMNVISNIYNSISNHSVVFKTFLNLRKLRNVIIYFC